MHPSQDQRCDHHWELDGGEFYCRECGQQEPVNDYLDHIESREGIDWQQKLFGGERAEASWIEQFADQIEGTRGPVTW